MVVRCRFCGQKIQSRSEVCEHCGKTLVKKSDGSPDKVSLVGIDSWQQKSVPAWVMYLVIGFALICAVIMFTRGCENADESSREQALRATHHCLHAIAASSSGASVS